MFKKMLLKSRLRWRGFIISANLPIQNCVGDIENVVRKTNRGRLDLVNFDS